ncbi:Ribonuclease 3 [Paramyrothecium foliicola]|nr:Ribonuclease 3 [Paramyrothecium foliicola]
MAKRSADELHQETTKRQRKPIDSLLSLVDNADDLIDCLQKLKQHRHQLDAPHSDEAVSHLRQRLGRLGKELLPSFQGLAFGEDVDADAEESQKGPVNQVEKSIQAAALSTPNSMLPVPHMSVPWVSSEILATQPPLPKILDATLESTVFSHPGLSLNVSYERLEWLGDAYLELFASTLIFQTFGHLSSGRSSQLREQLVRNTTLAGYFRAYNLPLKAKLPREFHQGKGLGRGSSKDKDLLKTQSDMFEAYVAAAIISDPENGLQNTMDWVRTLWGQTIRDQIQAAEKTSKTGPVTGEKISPPKEQLARAIGAKGILIQYKDIQSNKRDPRLNLPLFTIGVYLTGWGERDKLLGTGTALNKLEAGHKAATVALQNKKLMQAYTEKKKAFLDAQKASQEGQEARKDA